MTIACRVREICQHEFTHANQIHEIWLTSGAYSSKSDGVVTTWCSYCLNVQRWGFPSGTGPVFIAPCVLALQVLESDHFEKLQARPKFTVFSHKDGSTSNSLESCAVSWPPAVYTSRRISRSREQFLEQSVPNSASRSRLTWLFRYTEVA